MSASLDLAVLAMGALGVSTATATMRAPLSWRPTANPTAPPALGRAVRAPVSAASTAPPAPAWWSTASIDASSAGTRTAGSPTSVTA